tara:strand:+ start:7293 stop:7406 length:114 start_codon:yes stop_codon:yes gene_type:complete
MASFRLMEVRRYVGENRELKSNTIKIERRRGDMKLTF